MSSPLLTLPVPTPLHFPWELKIFDTLAQVENLLSLGSAIPWGGLVFGNIKIIGGVALMAIGLASLGLGAFISGTQAETYRRFGGILLNHGVINVIAGFIERIAFVGTLLWVARVIRAKKETWSDWVFPKNLCTWIPYPEKIVDVPITSELLAEQTQVLEEARINLEARRSLDARKQYSNPTIEEQRRILDQCNEAHKIKLAQQQLQEYHNLNNQHLEQRQQLEERQQQERLEQQRYEESLTQQRIASQQTQAPSISVSPSSPDPTSTPLKNARSPRKDIPASPPKKKTYWELYGTDLQAKFKGWQRFSPQSQTST